jgi:predicted dehydrogenase
MPYHIIGLGSIGMRHARNLIGMGKLVFGSDADSKRIDMLIKAGGYGHTNGVLSYDGTLVCTPTKYHFAGLCEGLDESKAVFVEKPLGTPGESQFFADMGRTGQPVMVGCHLRFHPCVIKARNWLPSIGYILHAHFFVNQYNDEYTDPVVLNWGSHEIDLAQHLLGSLEFISGYGSDKRMVLNFMRDKTDITVETDYVTFPHRRGFVICGTKGNIVCDLEHGTIEQRQNRKDRDYCYEGPYNGIYIDEMKAFVKLCEGTRSKNDSYATLQDGIDVLRLIERTDTGGSYGWTGRKVEKVGTVKAKRSERKVRRIKAA